MELFKNGMKILEVQSIWDLSHIHILESRAFKPTFKELKCRCSLHVSIFILQ